MTLNESPVPMRARVASLPRVLTQWEAAGRVVYNTFSYIHRHPLLSHALAFSIYAALLYVVNSTLNMHKDRLPQSGPSWWFYYLGVPVVVLILALFVYTVPFLLIAHLERQRETILSHAGLSLNRISQEIMRAAAERPPNSDEIKDAFDALIASVEKGGSTNCIFTPTAFYLRADSFRAYLLDHLKTSGPLDQIEVIASKAPRFRDALERFAGDIHFILPDPNDRKVQEYFRSRALILDLPEDILLKINADSVNWVKRELKPSRRKRGSNTFLHLMNRSPAFRFMMLDDVCYLQQFPIERHGVEQRIVTIRRDLQPEAFAGVECGLRIISRLF